MKTAWKSIAGFSNYEIDNVGNIRSVPRIIERSNSRKMSVQSKILSPRFRKDGYLDIGLMDNSNQRVKCLVHRLVAVTHIPNIHDRLYVNHVDGNKLNNSIGNLEWVTFLENMRHAWKTGLRNADWNKVPVVQLDKNYKTVREYESIKKAGLYTQTDGSSIIKVCKGIRKIAGGFIWKYSDRSVAVNHWSRYESLFPKERTRRIKIKDRQKGDYAVCGS